MQGLRSNVDKLRLSNTLLEQLADHPDWQPLICTEDGSCVPFTKAALDAFFFKQPQVDSGSGQATQQGQGGGRQSRSSNARLRLHLYATSPQKPSGRVSAHFRRLSGRPIFPAFRAGCAASRPPVSCRNLGGWCADQRPSLSLIGGL